MPDTLDRLRELVAQANGLGLILEALEARSNPPAEVWRHIADASKGIALAARLLAEDAEIAAHAPGQWISRPVRRSPRMRR